LTLVKIQAKKSLGQNFLVDPGIAQRIVDSCRLAKNDIVLEIGPGQGALTGRLIETEAKVIAVEIDDRCADILVDKFSQSNFQLIRGDILRLDIETLLAEADPSKAKRLRVVANLPYNISTPVIQHFLENHHLITDMTLMLQKEVVERIVSEPGSKEYGSLSVFVQYFAEVRKLFDVSPQAFRPIPKVVSSVIRLMIREKPIADVGDQRLFFKVVRAAFAQRRKTLTNNLKSMIGDAASAANVLNTVGIDPQRRAETLSIPEFASISCYLATHNKVV
jgi:16S rRNA (adenine1518-N6/adenine1519-N6)-dimethyltransferase